MICCSFFLRIIRNNWNLPPLRPFPGFLSVEKLVIRKSVFKQEKASEVERHFSTQAARQAGFCPAAPGSHWSSRTMDGSLLAPSMNSSIVISPSLSLSIWRKILSVRFSGVDSSSGIFITVPTILQIAWTISSISALTRGFIKHLFFAKICPIEPVVLTRKNFIKT